MIELLYVHHYTAICGRNMHINNGVQGLLKEMKHV